MMKTIGVQVPKPPCFFLHCRVLMGVQLFFFFFFLLAGCSDITKSSVVRKVEGSHQSVTLQQSDDKVVMDNGIVSVTLTRPDGNLIGVSYNGIDNLLEPRNRPDNRGYWDFSWNPLGDRSSYYRFKGTTFSVIMENQDQAEVSFLYTWNSSLPAGNIPMNVDIRYILRRGSSGLYSYAILERSEDFPAIRVDVFRLVYKLSQDLFHYMAISDERQREMPTAKDRSNGQTLDYPEAVLLTHPSNSDFLGEVDDKYMYSVENRDNKVSGWVTFNSTNSSSVGFWMITPSNEFRNGGPTKQSLTCHVGPVTLNSFLSPHYAGKDMSMIFKQGESYTKVFGPTFLYLNTAPNPRDSQTLWQDAKNQMQKEADSWPYDFPQSKDFVPPNQRGKVSGQLLIRWYATTGDASFSISNAYVGLALPGDEGSWQTESKGYQFWTQPDNSGFFTVQNVVPGNYNLYAWVPGILGDYKYQFVITVTPGDDIQLGPLYYWPPRNGPTVWEIGIPDRSAQEFYVPDPYPNLVNKLYLGKPEHRFRQYGLWKRYVELYPTNDLVYTVGVSDYSKDWFYAQVPRDLGNGTYISTTWEIRFELPFVVRGSYALHISLASATNSRLIVSFNKGANHHQRFNTGLRGEDNAVARHGIHGLCWRYSMQVPSYLLVRGTNTIYLTQPKAKSPFEGIMYDYIRFESPSLFGSGNNN
ncbi:probable rhamnogalacturonate lyase B [Prosopis cineraria]|uniref:probable rhamnogalacturonate lyase B n=1 Tax=Prosopis cineraria TaxID=364024 RepID=UPI00240EDDFD|nr:probable rhamnogalacturonate lyase B [Prosopis cineraria]